MKRRLRAASRLPSTRRMPLRQTGALQASLSSRQLAHITSRRSRRTNTCLSASPGRFRLADGTPPCGRQAKARFKLTWATLRAFRSSRTSGSCRSLRKGSSVQTDFLVRASTQAAACLQTKAWFSCVQTDAEWRHRSGGWSIAARSREARHRHHGSSNGELRARFP